jgi:hypothetical protein
MTNRDPDVPNPKFHRSVGKAWGPGPLFSIAILGLLLVLAVAYGLSGERSPPNAAAPRLTTPAPSSVGQGDNAPAPTVPQPRPPR